MDKRRDRQSGRLDPQIPVRQKQGVLEHGRLLAANSRKLCASILNTSEARGNSGKNGDTYPEGHVPSGDSPIRKGLGGSPMDRGHMSPFKKRAIRIQ
jgi:hypothetical protein